MKKLFTTLLLLIVFALGTKAQTKEETIDWIQSKINKGGLSGPTPGADVSCDGTYITIKYDSSSWNDYNHPECVSTVRIPLNSIIRIDAGNYGGYYHANRFDIYTAGRDITMSYDKCSIEESSITSSFGLKANYNFEENFIARLDKAFSALIRFNKENMPKEVY